MADPILTTTPAPVDPLDTVTPGQLMLRHDEYRKWQYEWADLRLMYRGGLEFEAAAGAVLQSATMFGGAGTTTTSSFAQELNPQNAKARRFLRQFEGEPDVKYNLLLQGQFYINYFSGILNYFRHWLFANKAVVRPAAEEGPPAPPPAPPVVPPAAPPQLAPPGVDAATLGAPGASPAPLPQPGPAAPPRLVIPDPPKWWAAFAANCNGGGKSFHDFLKDQFLETLLTRRSGWMIGRPSMDPEVERLAISASPTAITDPGVAEAGYISQAMAEELGLTQSLLTPYASEEILDWQHDASGRLMWIVVVKRLRVRVFPRDRELAEVYTYVDRQRWRSWQVRRASPVKPNQSSTDNVSLNTSGPGDTLQVVGDGWHGYGQVPFVMFELPHDLWLPNQIKKVCLDIYNRQNRLHFSQTQAMFAQPTLTSEDPNAASRIMGDSLMFTLKPGESLGFVAPPTAPYSFISESIGGTVQELYRQVHQLSLAVDTKAVSAVARSGASKAEDRKSIEVILTAFGGYVRESILYTLNLVSKVQGDRTKWTCAGFDEFDIPDLEDQINAMSRLATVPCWSGTAKREVQKQFWTGQVLSSADEAVRAQISSEIEAHQEPLPPSAAPQGPPTPEPPPAA